MNLINNLESFFTQQLSTLNISRPTKAYVVSVLARPQSQLINESITLVFAQAMKNHKFELFQQIGDWLLVARTIFPNSLKDVSSQYYNAIAQQAYYKCYKLINQQWPAFEEISDVFPTLVDNIKELLISSAQIRFL